MSNQENPSVGQVLLDLFKESVIVQSLITLVVIGVLAYRIAVTGSLEGVPDFWMQLTTLVVGYWFGAKGSFQAVKTNRATLQALREVTETFAANQCRAKDA